MLRNFFLSKFLACSIITDTVFLVKLMRKIFWALFIIVAIFIGAWFGVAGFIESKLKSGAVENLHLANGAQIKVSGFPVDFVITLSKPRFDIPVNNGEFSIQFNGDLNIYFGWLLESVTLKTDGGATIVSNINGRKFMLMADAARPTTYKISLTKSPLYGEGLQTIIAAGDKPELIASLLDNIKIDAVGTKITTAGGDNFFNAERVALDIVTKIGDQSLIDVRQQIANMQFYDSVLPWWNSVSAEPIVSKFYQALPESFREYLSVFTFPSLGKINFNLNLVYKGRADRVELDIKKLELKDNLENISLTGGVISDSKSVSLDLTSDSSFSERWYNLMQVYAQKFANFTPKKQSRTLLGQLFVDLRDKIGSNNKLVYAAYVPKLQEYGQIHNRVKMNLENSAANYIMQLDEFDFAVKPYSVNVSGSYNQQGDANAFNIKVKLSDFSHIYHDAFSYVQRVVSTYGKKLLIGSSVFNFSEKTKSDLKDFILSLANNVSGQDVTITASKTMSSKFPAVGKYNAAEFAAAWLQFTSTIVVNEVKDKVEKYLPKEIQDTVKKHVDKIAPIADLLSILQDNK